MSKAESRSLTPPGCPSPAGVSETLPLRLSVVRGGLGIELTEPVRMGALVVDELDVGLTGLQFPLDLSGGVKQFRNRRGILRRAAVRLDLQALAAAWQDVADNALGWRGSHVRAIALPARSQQPAGEKKSRDDVAVVAVSVFSDEAILAFDVVLTSGQHPRWVIDRARGIGLLDGPLRLALRLVDAGLSLIRNAGEGSSADPAFQSTLVEFEGLRRVGRAVELAGWAGAISLQVMPCLGFRVPQIPSSMSCRAELSGGAVRLVMDSEEGPARSGARAVRLAGLADFAQAGDDALANGALDEAREAYLRGLERAPHHPELLAALAEVDATHGNRNESALAFIDERGEKRRSVDALLLQFHILEASGRPQAALDCLRAAHGLEEDSALGATIALNLARRASDDAERDQCLQLAVGQAPYLAAPRWERLQNDLVFGRSRRAGADAEHLEGLACNSAEKARTAGRIARSFLKAGFTEEARAWVLRALKYRPDDLHNQLNLAVAFDELGESVRAAELYQSVLRKTVGEFDGERSSLPSVELLDQARLDLAAILADRLGDDALALGYLEDVSSRSPIGLRARMRQREILEKRGDLAARERIEARTLEAIELGWIAPSEAASALQTIRQRNQAPDGSPDLERFAARLSQR